MSPSKDFLGLFCCKKPSFLCSTPLHPRGTPTAGKGADSGGDGRLHHLQSDSNGDLLFKPFVDHQDTMEVELMMLAGPPKLLFTIEEETEDLESEGGRVRKGSRRMSLGDLFLSSDTPFLTPLSSSPLPAPSPIAPLDYISQNGFSPLFECSKGEDLSKTRTSPPPAFKFLRDAEEKLLRKILMEEAFKVQRNDLLAEMAKKEGTVPPANVALPRACPQQGDASFITVTIEGQGWSRPPTLHSDSSQVIPVLSSPLRTTTTLHEKTYPRE